MASNVVLDIELEYLALLKAYSMRVETEVQFHGFHFVKLDRYREETDELRVKLEALKNKLPNVGPGR